MDFSGIDCVMQKVSNSLTQAQGIAYNAIFKLSNGSGNVIEDDLGNYTFETLVTEEIQVTLWEVKATDYVDVAETDLARTYMRGYCVDPSYINKIFDNYVDCDLKQDGEWIKGRFTFIDKITTALEENYTLANCTGQKVFGYFERKNDRA